MKYLSLLLSSLAASCLAAEEKCEPSVTTANTVRGPICKGALIFEDTFDFIDTSKWSHEISLSGGGNWEFQVYWDDPINSYTKDGNLHIHPGKLADIYGEDFLWSGTIDFAERCTASWYEGCSRTGTADVPLNPATSARLHTTNKFYFKYGTIEARIKIPTGDWLWPTFWIMPQFEAYGTWPLSGEVDIMENRGNRDSYDQGVHIGVEQVKQTLHWGPDREHNQFESTEWRRNTAPGQGYNQDFHTYRLEWTPDHMMFSVDGSELATITPPDGGFYEMSNLPSQGIPNPWSGGSKMAPFDQEFFIILNVAVGGTNGFFSDFMDNLGGKPWVNDNQWVALKDFWVNRAQWEPTWQGESTDMQVDYVRVWAADV